jgi:tetratricopeptide (TPR) repeat protein
MPRVAFAIGRTYEREQNWHTAVTNYEAWLSKYPTNELRPQVEYARAWAVSQTGDEAGAFKLFSQYPTNAPLAPLAYWWVADHYFRLGGTNFVPAELNYQLIFQYFPTNELAYPAQFMAGRAAMGRFGYTAATGYFKAVINTTDTNCPEDLKDKARFAYCEALRLMPLSDTNNANLQEAVIILSQMYPKAATNIVGALAWCESGDCNFLMGLLDAATNAYVQVLNSPTASQELRNRAQVGLGVVLKKKAEGLSPEAQRPLLLLALNNFADVLYNTNAVVDAFMVRKAAFEALPLMMTLKEGDVNKFFDSLERWLPALKDTLEKKRATLNN